MIGDASNPLYVVPKGVETRWASPENPTGEKGSAARSNGGRKGSAFFPLRAGKPGCSRQRRARAAWSAGSG